MASHVTSGHERVSRHRHHTHGRQRGPGPTLIEARKRPRSGGDSSGRGETTNFSRSQQRGGGAANSPYRNFCGVDLSTGLHPTSMFPAPAGL